MRNRPATAYMEAVLAKMRVGWELSTPIEPGRGYVLESPDGSEVRFPHSYTVRGLKRRGLIAWRDCHHRKVARLA